MRDSSSAESMCGFAGSDSLRASGSEPSGPERSPPLPRGAAAPIVPEDNMLAYIRATVAAKKGEDTGASAVEYGLLVAAIAAIIILLVFALGGFVKSAFQDTCDGFEAGATNPTGSNLTCP